MTTWNTIDFRPAAAGWRALFVLDEHDLEPGPGYVDVPLAGWLIQERPRPHVAGLPERRVIAAVVEEWGEPQAVTVASNYWQVLGPGQPLPTEAETSTQREYQIEMNRRLRAGA